jgi:hypothetical protein
MPRISDLMLSELNP